MNNRTRSCTCEIASGGRLNKVASTVISVAHRETAFVDALFQAALVGSEGGVARSVPEHLDGLVKRIGDFGELTSRVVVTRGAVICVGHKGETSEGSIGIWGVVVLKGGVCGEC